MNTLYLINEIYTNGSISNILNIISLIAVICGIFVIISKNPIISVLFLIGLFAGISSYLIILGLTFIGLAYLVVYIGAISILFLFILMLINIRISELQGNTNNSILLSILIGIFFSYTFFELAYYNLGSTTSKNNLDIYLSLNASSKKNLLNAENNPVLFVTSNTWDGNLAENSHITAIGNIMYTNYSIWLIIASFILLLAMVGAIVITMKQKN
jgi:NADH-ubiquinone oxidoreductase chain 6